MPSSTGEHRVRLILDHLSLLPGRYAVAVALLDGEGICFYDLDDRRVTFTIVNRLDRSDSAYPGVRRGHFGVGMLERRWEIAEA